MILNNSQHQLMSEKNAAKVQCYSVVW